MVLGTLAPLEVSENWKIVENSPFGVWPLPAPPGPKFSGDLLGPPKRCQTPLELGQNLFPVSSYGGLNIPKIASLGVNISTTPDPSFNIISAFDRTWSA